MELIGAIKMYDWGKLGATSEVAQLVITNNQNNCENNNINNVQTIDETLPYAELWMGDHASGPARLKSTNENLNDKLTERLSYLFKVLSIRKALSIQVHPDKEEAERLHKQYPDIYKDANHKPELAIALTPFTALCGFRPYHEIYDFIMQLPPLKKLINVDNEILIQLKNDSMESLKTIYKILMTADEQSIKQTINAIQNDYINVLRVHNLYDLFSTIHCDFPGDVGVLSIFFLNVIHLQPGEAIYLNANEIHAYIQGDCIECMACSDNVIRAGLTPKYKDVHQLLRCLNYKGQSAESKYFKPIQLDHYSKVFAPPVRDFAVIQINIPKHENNKYTLKLQQKPSILITIRGQRFLQLSHDNNLLLKRGSIIYLPSEYMANVSFISNKLDLVEDFIAYLAQENCFNC